MQPDAEVVDRQVDVVQRREHQPDIKIVGGLGLHLRIAAGDVTDVFGHHEHRIEYRLIRHRNTVAGLGQARRPEALRTHYPQAEFANGLPAQRGLGRELAARVLVVLLAPRQVDLERLQDRQVQFIIDARRNRGRDRAAHEPVRQCIVRLVVDRFATELQSRGGDCRARRQIEQPTAPPQIQGIELRDGRVSESDRKSATDPGRRERVQEAV